MVGLDTDTPRHPKPELAHHARHWAAHDLDGPQLYLLLELWAATNDHGYTTIHVRALADRLGKSPGTIQNQLARLVAAGHLTKEERGRHASPRRLLLKPSESCVTCADRLEAEHAAELADLAHYGLGPVEKLSLDSTPARSHGVAHSIGPVRDPMESRVVTTPEDADEKCRWVVDDDGYALEAVG